MTDENQPTSLAKKLGLKEGQRVLLYNAPNNYWELFNDDIPEELHITKQLLRQSADFVHVFFISRKEMEVKLPKYLKAMKKSGTLWVSWPKTSSPIKSDIKRDLLRSHILKLGLVDTKVAAIDSKWSGLKFVYRLKNRR